MTENRTGIDEYNEFCRKLRKGVILYNINPSNFFGEYLLVAHITHVVIDSSDTYTVLLLGMKRQDGKYIPTNFQTSLTPENMEQISFLKHVGCGKFTLVPVFDEINVNLGLITVYSQTDLHKFTSKLSIRKPRARKYGKDGKLIVNNK